MSKAKPFNPLTMTDEELIEHCDKQVQALRMALDMIECEKHDRRHVRWAIVDALKEWKPALAEQPAQQEPVVLPCCGFTDARAVRWNFYNKVVQCHNCGQVYTSPPAQRTWVGLTDEEREALWYRFGYMELMRAIEAKLKEKNT